MNDSEIMKVALDLAEKGKGFVSPNPKVGAVIVKNGEIISQGWHKKFGSPHAEVEAIKNAKLNSFEDTTLYVTLEPCCHVGKTPPCVDLILEKKIPRVVISMLDPNPLVNGKGIEILRNSGVNVEVGILEEESRWQNRFFIKYVNENKPYIIIKIAQTLDGFIATSNGASRWITSEDSRRYTHELRSDVDAVLIGKNTASADNPELTVRMVEGRNPLKVVCDTHLTLPLDLKLFKNDDRDKTILCCSANASTSRKAEVLKMAGVKIFPVEVNDDGKLNLDSVLNRLTSNYNTSSIMVEGGAHLFSTFLKKNLIDEIQLFTAPKILGNGLKSFADIHVDKLKDAYQFKQHSTQIIGNDILSIFVRG